MWHKSRDNRHNPVGSASRCRPPCIHTIINTSQMQIICTLGAPMAYSKHTLSRINSSDGIMLNMWDILCASKLTQKRWPHQHDWWCAGMPARDQPLDYIFVTLQNARITLTRDMRSYYFCTLLFIFILQFLTLTCIMTLVAGAIATCDKHYICKYLTLLRLVETELTNWSLLSFASRIFTRTYNYHILGVHISK